MTLRPWIIAGLLLGVVAGLGLALSRTQGPGPSAQPTPPLVAVAPRIRPLPEAPVRRRTVMDISLHDEAELKDMLHHLDALQRAGLVEKAPVAVVLHGPEIAFFTRKGYASHRELIDLAGRLDAAGVIEVKACRTRMRMMGVKEEDLPDFVETVPFGPGEILRLQGAGYEVRRLF
ncbi:MAG: hypothetical protein D6717_08995 [Gammaproteobacteria bacterium]|nr:MAG: hypothetical protein D6717_08995 [Gammaproteobacteria bacterium]